MTRRLEAKRCLVTGGSRGLGLALCLAFASEGAKIAFTYSKHDDDAKDAREQLSAAGVEPIVFKGSVADAAHVQATVSSLVGEWGGIDILVNNAGVNQILPVALVEEADWDFVMGVNAKGAFLFSRAVLKPMIRAKSGKILNIGAFSSERVIESPVHYAASKSALRGLTEAMAREVGRYGISVNLLSPGLLDCGLGQMVPEQRLREYLDKCPAGRVGSATEVARAAAWLVSDANSFMTAGKVVLDGGL